MINLSVSGICSASQPHCPHLSVHTTSVANSHMLGGSLSRSSHSIGFTSTRLAVREHRNIARGEHRPGSTSPVCAPSSLVVVSGSCCPGMVTMSLLRDPLSPTQADDRVKSWAVLTALPIRPSAMFSPRTKHMEPQSTQKAGVSEVETHEFWYMHAL